jgi:hypothetical protein
VAVKGGMAAVQGGMAAVQGGMTTVQGGMMGGPRQGDMQFGVTM